jgi:hypothetical protein
LARLAFVRAQVAIAYIVWKVGQRTIFDSEVDLMNLDQAFDEIAAAMAKATTADGHALASRAVDRHGLVEQGDGTPKRITVWETSADGKTLRFQWRWYDPSQAFSIRPDMNVLTLELLTGDTILRKVEERYEDRY